MNTEALYAMVLDCQDSLGTNHEVELVTNHSFEDLISQAEHYLFRNNMTTVTPSRRMIDEIGLYKIESRLSKVFRPMVDPQDDSNTMTIFCDSWSDEENQQIVVHLSVAANVLEAEARLAYMKS